jgi:hypothetical protein
MYNGDQLQISPDGLGYVNLDGTWTHDNGSDAWDGSVIGDYSMVPGLGYGTRNAPGGAILGTNGSTTYLRMQDCGDPRDYDTAAGEWNDPSSRKIYFGHNIGSDIDPTKAQTIMRSGVTLTFRARVPTLAKAGPPLDPLLRDGQNIAGLNFPTNGVLPYPDGGDGYVTSDGGKGNFVIREGGNGVDVPAAAIAFSLTLTNDTTGGAPTPIAGFAGLTFNEFNGNVPSASVNFGQGSKTNVVAFDPTDWHELYIVIRDDPADIGTHEAFIFRDGIPLPTVFKITGGTGADMPDSFLAMGGSATPQNWALDVDFFGYKDEAVFPPGALLPPSLFGFAPANAAVYHPAASGLKFRTSALMPTNTLPASGIKVTLNGQDVSSQLVLTGTDASQSRDVTYNGLQPNGYYTATYIVTDSGGLSTTNDIFFDTFVEAQITSLEAEDYNYGGGQYFDNAPPNSYFGAVGNPSVDFQDTTPNSIGAYRSDAVDMAATTDQARTNKFPAGSGLTDYNITSIVDGEWWNYTASFTNPPYTVWLRYASTAPRRVRVDRVLSDPSQTNQTLQFVGFVNAPSSGALTRYSYAQPTDMQGNVLVLPFGGTNTYRLTALGANNDLVLNYFFLVGGATPPSSPLVAVTPLPAATGVRGDAAVEATIYDGSSPVSLGSVKLLINGAEVPAAKSSSGGVTTVKYPPVPLWPPNTTLAVSLVYNDGTNRTNDWSFTTGNYRVLTPAMKVTGAATPGLVWRMHQNEANQDNSVQKVLDAISGALNLANLADPNVQGPASAPGIPATPGNGMMTFNIPTVINVSQTGGNAFGSFTPDDQMPGIPGTTLSDDGIAVEITTMIQLASGFHTMAVNCDDGFRTTAGFVNSAPSALLLGIREPGGGAADTIFNFAVQDAGVYAFRTLYWEGGGSANLEWFMIKSDGSRVLVNDTANGGPAGFQEGTIPIPPDVTISASLNASRQVVLQWSVGTLLSAASVNGPYTPVAGATSPYVVNPGNAPAQYYRVQTQ